MTELDRSVSPLVIEHLTVEERDYLNEIFRRFGGYPTLEQVWKLMDEPWRALGCDPLQMDDRVLRFYMHPVWMLNGLFIEQHDLSLRNRQGFTAWVALQKPRRVADFGGGFGGLARFIGDALPSARIEVVEPHPHPAAIALAAKTSNVRYVPELGGEYDLLIATDVFEPVPDPIGLAHHTATYLRTSGQYLMANCFQPVILCHLPQLFHFHYAWDDAMRAMGLEPAETVLYGRAYRRAGEFDVPSARRVGECARKLYPWIQRIPRGKARIGRGLVRALCR
jgi:hypothetical protein